MQSLLAGMRVIEGSAFVAAPSGGMTLAQLGADVIRFDPIGGGLDYRRWPVTSENISLYWHSLNKGKRSIAADFRRPEGQELLARLITAPGDDAGLFLTNFPAKGWLSYDNLRSLREDIIYLNLTGDRHHRGALDYTVNCKVGLPFLNAPRDASEPLNNPLPAWDVIAGQQVALGLLAAERYRSRTGRGQMVNIALADVALATMGNLGYIAEVMVNQRERESLGNYIYGTYGHDFLCRDGERVMVVGVSPNQWKAILAVTDSASALAELEQALGLDFSREGDRYQAGEKITTVLKPWFAQRDFVEVSSALDGAGACWGRYQSIREMVENDIDCSVDNPLFQRVMQPGVGEYLMPAHPLEFGDLERGTVEAAPMLGEHTEEILSEVLGLDASEISKLFDQNIVASHVELD